MTYLNTHNPHGLHSHPLNTAAHSPTPSPSSFISSDGRRVFPPSGTPISYPGTVYSSAPPPGTPITPGTQIILSEGVANNISLGGVTRVSPMVSLPLHPLPPTSSQDHLGITR